MLTEAIADTAVRVLETTGYAGACALMALESMIVPVPSEAVMPFVGFQVADGHWNLSMAVAATSLGSVLGSLLSYAIGCYGGRPVVVRFGRYLLLNLRDLERAERFFHHRRSFWTIFIARFIPVVRHLISIPAGTGRMPLGPFLLATFSGATLWNGFLLFCGMKLRERWELVLQYSHQLDIAVAVVLLLSAGWYVRQRLGRNPAG
ncbi:MAG TPA: DedA family protein [Gammaproteobacteria bacterium]|nr:DedA family protein [Gammaproteobacteria bacterium]